MRSRRTFGWRCFRNALGQGVRAIGITLPLTWLQCSMEYDSLQSEEVVFSDQDEDIEYEDLETSSRDGQSSFDARSVVEWSQRLLIASRVLTIAHIVLNVRLILFAWSLYSVLGRFFIMLPLALEIVLSLVFEAIGAY